jgi:hypothetical protein
VSGPGVYTNEGTPMGVGNQVSLEFNLVYRWHAAISDRDDKWTQGFTKKVFPGIDMSKITIPQFVGGMARWKATLDPDPSKRDLDLGQVKRDPTTGLFNDQNLIDLLTSSTEDCAGTQL